jgi:TetR/AcrR family tetracycline transcriptional repressor
MVPSEIILTLYRLSRIGRPRRGEPTLSRERVVARALQLADAEGVQAVTMRRLASLLGVEAMALYTHVASKDDLLDAVGARIVAELAVEPRPREDWRGRIEAVVRAWASMRARHPRAFPLVFRSGAPERVLPVTEELIDALRTAGFDESEAALAYQTLVFLLDAPLLAWPSSPPAVGWRRGAERVPRERFPRYHEVARHAHEFDWDDVYANGLALLLDGLEARLRR